MQHYVYKRDKESCRQCRTCITRVSCPSPHLCVGCGACYLACPNDAIHSIAKEPGQPVNVVINGQDYEVPGGITVKAALESLGIYFTKYPEPQRHFAPCGTGGCYACAVIIDNELRPACHSAIQTGQNIETRISSETTPLRIVGWYQSHAVGGVGTPWIAKAEGREIGRYVEVACFAAGCNLRCRTCQNSRVTYDSRGPAVTPHHAAESLMQLCRTAGLHRAAISGGEPTLNRRWLLQFFAALNEWSKGDVRLHLDTNATILTNEYIDHLVQAGVTDIGPDLKAARLDTFQIITGIRDAELARKYLDTEWNAVKYIADNYYPGNLFMGVGFPYNPAFYQSSEAMKAEIHKWASRVAVIDDRIQVTILDYRPEFRRLDLQRPSINEMKEIKAFIEGVGLRTVVAQTSIGHLPPVHPAPDRG